VALHARAAKRQRILDVGTKRQVPLRAVLLILAMVPSVAMIGLWAVNSNQLYNNWRTVSQHNAAANRLATPVLTIYYSLQTERQLTAAALADPGAYQAKLVQQRRLTDASVSSLAAVAGSAPANLEQGIRQIEQGLAQLVGYRSAVDQRTATQEQTYDAYTNLIASDLELFDSQSNAGIADINYKVRPVIDSVWAMEMLSREDAIMTPGVIGGRISGPERSQLVQVVGTEQFIYNSKVLPLLPAAQAEQYRQLMAGSVWQQKTRVEQAVMDLPGTATQSAALSASLGKQWQQSFGALAPVLQSMNVVDGASISVDTNTAVHAMAVNLVVNSAVGAAGVILVVGLTLWLTGVLRRRIFALRSAALDMQVRLPDVVERLRRGETVDPDAELPELSYGRDELGMLGQALNAARSTAVETAVRQVEQYRGFERLLQRIARRTQLLIGLQMKRLTEMERRHEDAEVLEGLFDLDHLTARLRRYEENLVILGGGQPQRRWRKPVALLDVLRSAQGEVQDYRRIRIETDSRTWLSERAVGAMVHVLAELMENAVAFSKPPTPVEVSASRVARGLAIEIEDRGMGMDPEQYAEANALMADPPRMDVISRADDARLGLYVVARLVAVLGVKVELRPSSFGGTRVVVLVPSEFVIDAQNAPSPAPEEEFALPPRLSVVAAQEAEHPEFDGEASSDRVTDLWAPRGYSDRRETAERPLVGVGARTGNGNGAGNGNGNGSPDPAPEPRLDPLPRRVRLASLVTELREPRYQGGEQPEAFGDPEAAAPPPEPRRSGAAVGAFQRQSRIARLAAQDDEQPTNHPSPGREPAPEEDGR